MRANVKKLEILMASKCIDKNFIQRKTKLSRPTINRIFVGDSVRPMTLGKLAKGLGIDICEILEVEE